MLQMAWTRCSFADLIEEGILQIGDGYRARLEELGGDGPIFLRAGHVADSHIDFKNVERFRSDLAQVVANKLAAPGDVVVTTKGNSTGRVTFVTAEMPPFVYSPHLSFWRSLFPSTLVPGFLRYWARSREFYEQLEGMKVSTDMAPYLSLVDQRRLRITLPEPTEQQAIAHILGTLDDRIELNRRINETLEAMARAIFKSWFVDFDPVRMKAEARQPVGMDAETMDLFPGRLVESELGPVPADWRIDSILKISSLISGGTPQTSKASYWDGCIHWASAKDVSQCEDAFLLETERNITEEGLANSATKIVPRFSSVVVARGATTGRLTMFGEDMAMNQTCYAVRSKDNVHLFLFHMLRRTVAALVHAAHGSVFDTITTTTFVASRVLLPPVEICQRFEALVAPLYAKVLQNLRESRTLAAIRDALLPKLLSGEIRVRDVEKFVGTAT